MSKGKKLTQEEFVQRCILTHGHLYDYSNSIYTGSFGKIIIACSIHGDFVQYASHHIAGSHCPKCASTHRINSHTKTNDEFIYESNIVHDYFYDYSKTIYKGIANRLTINCPIHGNFTQFAGNHLSGNGCMECGKQSNSDNSRITLEDFINQANKIHNNKYDYSESIYLDYKTKVKIICVEHGPFMQTVGDHISVHGCGCPSCGKITRIATYIKNSNLGLHNKETKFSKTQYKDSGLMHQSSYELDFLELCDKRNILDRIKNAPCLSAKSYPYNFYLPDYILDDNYIIEIKSWYIENLQESRYPGILKLKEQLVIDKGYKFLYIKDKDYSILENIIGQRRDTDIC